MCLNEKLCIAQAKKIKTVKIQAEKTNYENQNPFEQSGWSFGNKSLFLMSQNSCYVKLIAKRKAANKDNFLSLTYNKVFI